MKKIIISIVLAVVVVIGGGAGYFIYNAHQVALENQKTDSANIDDTLSNTSTSSSPSTPMSLDEMKGIISQTGKDLTPAKLSTLFANDTTYVNKLDNHQYALRQRDGKDYLIIQFNDSETSVVSVVKD